MDYNNISGIKELGMIELPSATLIEVEHDIVMVHYKDVDEEIDVEEAKKHTEAIYELRAGKPCHLIINFLEVEVPFTNAARDYFAHNERHSAIRISQAIVIDGLAQKIVANFYKTFNKPNCPVELFQNEADALKWSISLDK